MAFAIDKARCPQNHSCPMLPMCLVGAISQEGGGLPQIAPDPCVECGKCVKICGMRAVYKKDEDHGKTV